MKKILKKMLVIISIVLLFSLVSANVFAAGSVTYEGDANEFIFSPGSEYSPTDLFTDFKNVMPGDSITQKVQIKNDISKNVKIKLYIRALGAQEGSEEFLSQLNLKVSQDGGADLFDAPASESAQLTDWVYLGTFYSGAQIDLNVTLDVPIELDNDYQKSVGYLDWQFKVEEFPVESNLPKTGDSSNILLYIILASVSCICLIMLMMYVRHRGRNNL